MKNYLLYTDKQQTKLLAQAYTKDEAAQVSLDYSAGQWISYEVIDDKYLIEETEKLETFIFGEEKTKELIGINDDAEWKLGGAQLR